MLDEGSADAGLNRLSDRIETALARAASDGARRMERELNRTIARITPIRLRVEADFRPFEQSLNTLRNLDSVPLQVAPELDREQFIAQVQAALLGAVIHINVVPNLDDFDTAIRAHRAPDIDVDVNVDTDRAGASISRFSSVLGTLGNVAGTAARIASIGVAAGLAAQGVATLGAALAPAVGIVAALPAVALGAVAATNALKLAMSGVGDAFSAALGDDVEKFNESLEKLSPAAQAAAREVRALKPQFDELRTSVQNGFFEQIEGEITKTATALSGPLQSGLTNISSAWGRAAQGVLGYLQGAQGVANVKSILAGAEAGVNGLADTTNKLTAGFLRVAASVSNAFGERFGAAISSAGQRFGDFLQEAGSSGQAVAWVEGALDLFKQLGSILGNVGSILGTVFGGMSEAGAGLLNNIEMLTGQFADFLKSAEGTQILTSIFDLLGSASQLLGTAFSAVLDIVKAVAPAFTTIVNAITPILPVIGDLISQLASGLAPVIAEIAGVIGDVLTAALNAILPILPPLVDAFLTLVQAIQPIVPIIGEALVTAIQAVSPILVVLAEAIGTIAEAIAPLVAQIIEAFLPAFEQMSPLITQLVEAIAPLITQLVDALLPILPPLIEAWLAIQQAILPLLPSIIELAIAMAPLVSLIISALAPIIQFGAELLKWLALNAVVPVIQAIITVLTGIIDGMAQAITGIVGFVEDVIGFFTNLNDNVTRIVAALIVAVVGFFQSLPGRARSAVSSIVSAVSGVFTTARDNVVRVVRDMADKVVQFVRELPGKAKSALGNIGSILYSAGADLIRGMINGVRSMAGRLASAAKSVAKGAVDGVKGFLGIHSPSRVFAEIGKQTGQGLINGLTGTESEIKQTAEKLAKAITDAFKGRKTTLDNRLVKQVQNTQSQLERLAVKREAVMKKIADANKFADDTARAALDTASLDAVSRKGTDIASIQRGLDAALARIHKFNTQVTALARRGLSKDLIGQLIGMGPDAGAELAASLSAATDKQLKQLNATQTKLKNAANNLGDKSADIMFDSGKQAANGFLSGLRSQEAALNDAMEKLAKKLASSIRKALGIHSPSRVFAEIGQFTAQGLVQGLDSMLSQIQASGARAAGAVTAGFTGSNRPLTPSGLNAITQPFGGTPGLGGFDDLNGRQTGVQPASRVTAAGASGRGGTTVAAGAIVINEVGDAEATANRVLNRLALAGVPL